MKQAREQKAVVEAIEKPGGTVGYFWTYDLGNDVPCQIQTHHHPHRHGYGTCSEMISLERL